MVGVSAEDHLLRVVFRRLEVEDGGRRVEDVAPLRGTRHVAVDEGRPGLAVDERTLAQPVLLLVVQLMPLAHVDVVVRAEQHEHRGLASEQDRIVVAHQRDVEARPHELERHAHVVAVARDVPKEDPPRAAEQTRIDERRTECGGIRVHVAHHRGLHRV